MSDADDFITRVELEQLQRRLQQLLIAPKPAVLTLRAAQALWETYHSRSYKAVVCVEYRDMLCAILIHETPNRVFGPLVWNPDLDAWGVMAEDRGLLIILKSLLPVDNWP